MCSPCDLGKYGSTKGSCSVCPSGRYQDGKGELQCKNCEVNTYLTEEGKSSKTECLRCSEQKSTGQEDGATSESSCLCKSGKYYQLKDFSCQACPIGGNCTCKNGVTMNEIVPMNGYWRPFSTSKIFSNCEQAYQSTDAEEKAKDRCNNILHIRNDTFRRWMRCQKNNESSTATIFDDANVQCKYGYRGNLCASCAKDFVKQGDDCLFCKGGANIEVAVGVLISLCFIIFIIVVLYLQSAKVSQSHASKYFGQLKIFLMFLQIVSAMPYSINSVKWPESFKFLALHLNFVNFEFMKLMDFSSCTLSLHPLNRFALHVLFVPLFVFAVIAAYATSMCVSSSAKRNKNRGNRATLAQVRRGIVYRIVLTILLVLYPGLGTRIFGIFRCSAIDGFQDRYWFQQDLSLECYVTHKRHDQYLQFAIASLILIVIGFPFVIAVELFRSRKHLHNEKSSKHTDIKFKFGGLYIQYEKEFWFFEIVVVLVKQIMTGALGVFKPGTPIQVGMAVLVMFIYLMVLLRFTPFKSSADDMLAYVSTIATLFIAMVGLFLKLDEQSESHEQNFNRDAMGDLLVAITLAVIFLTFLNLILIKMKVWDRIEKLVPSNTTGTKDFNSATSSGSHAKRNVKSNGIQRRLTANIQNVVVHHKANTVIINAEEHRNEHRKRVSIQMNKSKAKLESRLKKRAEKKKEMIEAKKNWVLPTDPSLEERRKNIEYFRALLQKKCKEKEKFNKIFSKVDKDNSGTINKKEFFKLTKSVIKGSDDGTAKNLLTDEMFDIIWADFCNKNDEVDCITASNWIFSDKRKL